MNPPTEQTNEALIEEARLFLSGQTIGALWGASPTAVRNRLVEALASRLAAVSQGGGGDTLTPRQRANWESMTSEEAFGLWAASAMFLSAEDVAVTRPAFEAGFAWAKKASTIVGAPPPPSPPSREGALEDADAALKLSAAQFRDYASQHRAKDPPQHEKATVNDLMARRCEQAIETLRLFAGGAQ